MMTFSEQQSDDRMRSLRDLLAARRRQLTEDLETLKTRLREHGSRPALAKEPEDYDPSDLDIVLVDIATATLHRVEHALSRLDDGEYGVCTRCRRRISESRLRAMLFAVRCQPCEAAQERETTTDPRPVSKRVWAEWHPVP